MSYTHLHVASGRSARYGAAMPSLLAERAAERGFDALALTDRDTVGGAVLHADACTRAGIRPVFGADLAVSALTPSPVRPGGRPRTPVRGGVFVDESAPRVVLLARDRSGWASLCRVISAAHAARAAAGGGQGQLVVPFEALRKYAAGLTVLLGPVSEPVRVLASGRSDVAARLLGSWREVFGRHLRLEAVHHHRPGTGPGSLRLAARTVGLAREAGVECVLTNAVRYADPGQAPVADVLDADRLLMPLVPGRTGNGER